MEISLHGYETPRELMAVKAALDVLIETPYVEDTFGAEVGSDARVDVPDLPPSVAIALAKDALVHDVPEPPVDDADINVEASPAPDRDKHGRIWDSRIDSSNKKQTTGGEWMKRKNVDDAVRQQVMAELSADNYDAPAAVFTPPAAPAVPVDPGAPPPPPEVAGAAAPNGPDWGEVFTRTMTAKTAELVSQEQIDAWVTSKGVVGGFPALIARPDLFSMFLIELGIE